MGWLEITQESLKEVVAGLGPIFKTKDVSEDPRMRKTYTDLARHSHYHAFVGRALSEYRAQLKIDEIRKGTPRGSQWKKI